MNNYKATTKIITILNTIAILRNFIDPVKHKFKFICSWILTTFLVVVFPPIIIYVQMNDIKQHMAYNIESVTYMFQYIIHDLGYISIVIIGQYQSKVNFFNYLV